ncbi:hypothetical protein DSM104299_04921 [Baekduia alba]|uniref:hypothetical protein n=1 Tax=Baekduia alba TaxID=2997333 RepID=UPI002341B6F9|nr:hypothetical protein [Baekduia alba]WCB96165.1 hypothetical protein DSM104299_04921 [Baekduia alba]
MPTGIMYIENKAGGLTGPARIGRVAFSKTSRTLYYDGKSFQSLKGAGFKSNYYDTETGEEYWNQSAADRPAHARRSPTADPYPAPPMRDGGQ